MAEMSQESMQKEAEAEKIKQLMAKMREMEYKGLSEEEIAKREHEKEMRRQKNIRNLEDTLTVLKKGSYDKDGQRVSLLLTPDQMKQIQVYLPKDIKQIKTDVKAVSYVEQDASTGCMFGCRNVDALDLAFELRQELSASEKDKVLVLNLASATTPGGSTRKGASAQEEALCRRSSLLLSLESEEAKKYYEYNQALKTRMGSDAVMITPAVEVIKDQAEHLLNQTYTVSVMTCAAPMVRLGLEGMSQKEYEELLRRRIEGMLLCAAVNGYRHLVLGAFGCGVYGNDAKLVSDLFAKAIQEFTYGKAAADEVFDSIHFAVLCAPGKDYNYKEFCRNFSSETENSL